MTAPERLPIATLIESRCEELGLSRTELGFLLGPTRPERAAGRVDALCLGSLTNRRSMAALRRLPDALQVDRSLVELAVDASRAILRGREAVRRAEAATRRAEHWAEYCASFEPHAVIETEREVPRQILFCGLAGGPSKFRRIALDPRADPETQPDAAFAKMKQRLQRWSDSGVCAANTVPFFGPVIGLTVNFRPHRAVTYDLEGRELSTHSRARLIGSISFAMG